MTGEREREKGGRQGTSDNNGSPKCGGTKSCREDALSPWYIFARAAGVTGLAHNDLVHFCRDRDHFVPPLGQNLILLKGVK